MKSWIRLRTDKHRNDIASIRKSRSAQWVENGLPDVASIAPDISQATKEQLDRLRGVSPALDPHYLEFVSECSTYPLVGVSSDDSFRMLEAERVTLLSRVAPKIIARWNSGPAKPMRTPPLKSISAQYPNEFDSSELSNAIVLAASDHGCDPALLWMSSPREEYWLLGSWDGCLRFSRIDDAFDYLLRKSLEGLSAALA